MDLFVPERATGTETPTSVRHGIELLHNERNLYRMEHTRHVEGNTPRAAPKRIHPYRHSSVCQSTGNIVSVAMKDAIRHCPTHHHAIIKILHGRIEIEETL